MRREIKFDYIPWFEQGNKFDYIPWFEQGNKFDYIPWFEKGNKILLCTLIWVGKWNFIIYLDLRREIKFYYIPWFEQGNKELSKLFLFITSRIRPVAFTFMLSCFLPFKSITIYICYWSYFQKTLLSLQYLIIACFRFKFKFLLNGSVSNDPL